ncbi:MAG: ORF6N domain-containing protein [Burkholderiales bacterium]
MTNEKSPESIDTIAGRILVLRGQRVMLDRDLAALYGVPTGRFNEAVRRNLARFPGDFMFSLNNQDVVALRSQFATSKSGRGGRRYVPYAFTEHGAIMAATILNSPRATEVSVFVVRAFVQLRETLATHKVLAAKLDELEQKTEALALKHDALAANTRAQFRQVLDALRELMVPLEPKRRPIGFIAPEDKKGG